MIAGAAMAGDRRGLVRPPDEGSAAVNGGPAMSAGPEAAVPEAAQAPPARQSHGAFGRALGTVLFFAVAGPLVGGLVVGFRDIHDAVAGVSAIGDLLYVLVTFVSVGVPAAYVLAFVPAVIVGIAFAAIDFGRRRSDPWLAVVIGALAGLLWPVPWGTAPATLSSQFERDIFIASIVSTWICWFASTRERWRRDGRAR